MRMTLNRLDVQKAELDGIRETEEEWDRIAKHVLALEDILNRAKKPRRTFSTDTSEDLKRAGVVRKRLVFDPAKVAELGKALPPNVEAEISDLHARIKKIYARVNMDYASGSRMILDAILLSLTEIASIGQRSVAILPGMRIPHGENVRIVHPISGYEVGLHGHLDYAIIEYDNVEDYKDHLLAPDGSRDDAFDISTGRLILVEAKRQSLERNFVSYIPSAISQAIASLKSANLPEVRFVLSDGHSWMFFILKLENGILTYYESAIRRLSRDVVEISDTPLREIVQLIYE